MTNIEQIAEKVLLAGRGQPLDEFIPAIINAAAVAMANHAGADMDKLATSLLTFFNILQDEAGDLVREKQNLN